MNPVSQLAVMAVASAAIAVAELKPGYPPLPKAVSSFGAAELDGYLYVYGGHAGTPHTYSTETTLGTFQRLNLANPGKNKWEDLPGGTGLQGLNLAAVGGKIYRVGGMHSRNKPGGKADSHSVAEVAAFDPKKMKWMTGPELPAGRSSHDVVSVGTKLVVVGGWQMRGPDEKPVWHETALVLDTAAKEPKWEAIPQPFKRRALTAAAVGAKVYVMGGLSESAETTQKVAILDLATGKWSEGQEFPGTEKVGFSPASTVVNSKLILNTMDKSVYALNDKGTSWEKVGATTASRFVHRLVPLGKDVVVAIAGAGPTGPHASLEVVRLTGAPIPIDLTNVQSMTVHGGSGNDEFTVASPDVPATLLGDSGNDSFTFDNGASVTGAVVGGTGSGVNTLDWSPYSTGRSIALMAAGAPGYDGTEASIGGGFENINAVVGSSVGANTLTGPNTYNLWNNSGTNAGGLNGVFTFNGIQNLVGGNSGDDYAFTGSANLTGHLAGGAGMETLDYTGYDSPVDVSLIGSGSLHGVQGYTASVTGSFDNIDRILGVTGSALDTANQTAVFSSNSATSLSLTGFSTATLNMQGNFNLSDSSPLTVTGIDDTGGSVAVTETGSALSTTGAITTGVGDIILSSYGTETIGAPVTAGGDIDLSSVGTMTIGAAVAASGGVTLNSTSGSLLVNAPVSSTSGNLTADAGGAIVESGSGAFNTPGLLTTVSATGETLEGPNTVGTFNATNSTSGNIALSNAASPLTITGISESGGGSIAVTDNGALTPTGAVTTAANGNISLLSTGTETISAPVTAGGSGVVTLDSTGGSLLINAPVSSTTGAINATTPGAITESGSGAIGTTGLLTTVSATGETLGGANTVGSFNAANSTSGNIVLADTANPLTVTGISETGGGSVSVSDTGTLTTTGAVTTAASGNIGLLSTGTETISAPVTAGGSGVVTLDSTGGSLLVDAPVSSTSGNINATATAAITEPGSGAIGTTGLLTTVSATGETLGGANTVGSFNATNSTSGNIVLTNTANPLTIIGISETGGGNVNVSDTGALTTTGAVTTAANGNIGLLSTGTETISAPVAAGGSGIVTLDSTGGSVLVNAKVSSTSGNIYVTAGGAITESGSGVFNTTGLLTASSATGESLTDVNTVGSFNATNITSGNIALTDTASPLTVTGISEVGGGNVNVSDSGALTTTGAVTTAANGNISLLSTGTQTISAPVTAGGSGIVTLDSTGGGLLINAPISSTTGAINVTTPGAITESGSGAIGTTGLLTTVSATGETLNGANTVGSFNAGNTTSGNIVLTNTASPLTITGISETGGGNVNVSDNGALTTTGAVTTAANGNISLLSTGTETISAPVTAGGSGIVTLDSTGGSVLVNAEVSSTSGNIYVTAGGAITESGNGAIGTPGLLTAVSSAGQTLNGANTVSSLNATNTPSGNFSLIDTAATLTITGISEMGGNLAVSNTGALTTIGVAAASTGNIILNSTGTLTLAAPVAVVVSNILYLSGGNTNDQLNITPIGTSLTGSTGINVNGQINDVNIINQTYTGINTVYTIGFGGSNNFQFAGSLTIPTVVSDWNGNDQVQLDDGNDVVYMGNGNDQVQQGGGSIHGGNGNNTVTAGNGSDQVQLGNGTNGVLLGNGNDNVQLGNGTNNTVVAGTGSDQVNIGNYNNTGLDAYETVTLGPAATTVNDAVNLGDGSHDKVTVLGAGNANVQIGQIGGNNTTGLDAYETVTLGTSTATSNDTVKLGDGSHDAVSLQGTGSANVQIGNNNNTGLDSSEMVSLDATNAHVQLGDGGQDTLTGGAGNDQVNIGSNNTAQDYSESASLGNGNDNVQIGDGNGQSAGGDTVSLGTGTDTVQIGQIGGNNTTGLDAYETVMLGSAATTANDTVKLGDGSHDMVTVLGTGSDNVQIGGNNTTGLDAYETVTVGAATSTASDNIQIGDGSHNSVTLLGAGNDQVNIGSNNTGLDSSEMVSLGATSTHVQLGDGGQDTLTGGAGNDQVNIGSNNTAQDYSESVTLGNGNDNVQIGDGNGQSTGGDIVTLGNGTDNVQIGGNNNHNLDSYDTVTVGTGKDQIQIGNGTHDSATGGNSQDNITFGTSGNYSIINGLTSDGDVVYTPAEVRTAYGINALPLDGTGQTIAIVDAYDNPDIYQTLDEFDSQYGTTASGATLYSQYGAAASFLTVLNQNGQASPLPETDPAGPGVANWEMEESLDVEWTHAMAPGATIILVETDSQSLSDLMAGVATAAAQPGVSVVSMSWGFQEGTAVMQQDEAAYDADLTTPAGHPSVTFVASTGDYGSANQEYPASSPNVVAVGGTTLTLNADNSYGSEIGWGYYSSQVGAFIGSGGGTSQYEPEPAYQIGVQSTSYRSTPDVSFDADPNTGVWIADSYNLGADNPWLEVGGTSLSAPSWAGLIALVDQGRAVAAEQPFSSSAGVQAQQALYTLPASDFNTITGGTNGAYTAAAGYNMVTGLGTPIANQMVPDLVAYQTVSQANQTAADMPVISGNGTGQATADLFNLALPGGIPSNSIGSVAAGAGSTEVASEGLAPVSSDDPASSPRSVVLSPVASRNDSDQRQAAASIPAGSRTVPIVTKGSSPQWLPGGNSMLGSSNSTRGNLGSDEQVGGEGSKVMIGTIGNDQLIDGLNPSAGTVPAEPRSEVAGTPVDRTAATTEFEESTLWGVWLS